MILRSLSPPAPAPEMPDQEMEAIWPAIERSQQQDFSPGCWLIPQPSHAALAGDIARELDPQSFPGITAEVAHAIALHDAGWSLDDAAIIQESRAKGMHAKPYPFLKALPIDTAAAWVASIEIAGKAAPIGGYLVSRHFAAIGENYRSKAEATADTKTAAVLERFLQQEKYRQQKLRKNLLHSDDELDRMVAALQFCDLLSLYISCGLAGEVEFPQQIAGKSIRLHRVNDGVSLTPSPLAKDATFSVAGLRHPRTPPDSSRTFTLQVRRP
ncbi:MAG TPA: DUF3891 family protein [Terriglobales bacterium]|nr:DUF3891 family protein [Terriglobales bacterium]